MKIVVPVKQVPEVAEVKVNEETGTLIREGVPSKLNPFDEYAVEESIKLRDQYGGEVTTRSMVFAEMSLESPRASSQKIWGFSWFGVTTDNRFSATSIYC